MSISKGASQILWVIPWDTWTTQDLIVVITGMIEIVIRTGTDIGTTAIIIGLKATEVLPIRDLEFWVLSLVIVLYQSFHPILYKFQVCCVFSSLLVKLCCNDPMHCCLMVRSLTLLALLLSLIPARNSLYKTVAPVVFILSVKWCCVHFHLCFL